MAGEKALEVVEVAPALPVVDVEKALEAWQKYQELCAKLLDENDYAVIAGTKHRKRSAWAKLRRAYGINTSVISSQYWETKDDWGFDIDVEASHPSGRHEVGDGSCSWSELEENYQRSLERGNPGLPPTRHNVRSKALTRAKNRATADIIGVGEITAEEVEGEAPRRKKRPKITPKGEALAWFREQCQNAGLSGETVFLKLGMPFDQYLQKVLRDDPDSDPMMVADFAFKVVVGEVQ